MTTGSRTGIKTYPITLRMNDGSEIDFDIDAEELFIAFGEPLTPGGEPSPARVAEMVGDIVLGDRSEPATFVRGFIPLSQNGWLRCVVRSADISAVIESEAAQAAQAPPGYSGKEGAHSATAAQAPHGYSGSEGAHSATAALAPAAIGRHAAELQEIADVAEDFTPRAA